MLGADVVAETWRFVEAISREAKIVKLPAAGALAIIATFLLRAAPFDLGAWGFP